MLLFKPYRSLNIWLSNTVKYIKKNNLRRHTSNFHVHHIVPMLRVQY